MTRLGRTRMPDCRSNDQPEPRGKLAAIFAPRPRALNRPDDGPGNDADGAETRGRALGSRRGLPPARATRAISAVRRVVGARALPRRKCPSRGSKRSSSCAIIAEIGRWADAGKYLPRKALMPLAKQAARARRVSPFSRREWRYLPKKRCADKDLRQHGARTPFALSCLTNRAAIVKRHHAISVCPKTRPTINLSGNSSPEKVPGQIGP